MERRAAWARSCSSSASAAVTRTPTVRVRRASSPNRGLAMVSLPAPQGSRGCPLARVFVKQKHILLIIKILIKISCPVSLCKGKDGPWTVWFRRGQDSAKPEETREWKYKAIQRYLLIDIARRVVVCRIQNSRFSRSFIRSPLEWQQRWPATSSRSSIETPSVTRASGRFSSFRALFHRRVESLVLGQGPLDHGSVVRCRSS